MNYYEILGVGPDATDQAIKEGYRREAMKWHPDRHAGAAAKGEADRRFKDLAVAYRTLRDPAARAKYDRQLEQQLRREFEARQEEQAQRDQSKQNFADTPPPFEEETASTADADQMFYEQMLDLAFELASRGIPEFNIFKMLMASGCPESLAKAVASTATKQGRRQTASGDKAKARESDLGCDGSADASRGSMAAKAKLPTNNSHSFSAKVMSFFVVVALVGIATAVALPAYQDYQRRAVVTTGFVLGSEAAQQIGNYYISKKTEPVDLKSTGFSRVSSETVKNVAFDSETGILSITFQDYFFGNNSLLLIPTVADGRVNWLCTSDGIASRYLPQPCKATQAEADATLAGITSSAQAKNQEKTEMDNLIAHIESTHPQFDEQSSSFNKAAVDWVLARQKSHIDQGQTPIAAMKLAMSDYDTALLQQRQSQVSPQNQQARPRGVDDFFGGVGQNVSLNFQNIDIRSVLQVFEDVSGRSFIADNQVRRAITIRVVDMPWTEAIRQILHQNDLAIIRFQTGYLIFPSAMSDELALSRANQSTVKPVQLSPPAKNVRQIGGISQGEASATFCQTWPSACK